MRGDDSRLRGGVKELVYTLFVGEIKSQINAAEGRWIHYFLHFK